MASSTGGCRSHYLPRAPARHMYAPAPHYRRPRASRYGGLVNKLILAHRPSKCGAASLLTIERWRRATKRKHRPGRPSFGGSPWPSCRPIALARHGPHIKSASRMPAGRGAANDFRRQAQISSSWAPKNQDMAEEGVQYNSSARRLVSRRRAAC